MNQKISFLFLICCILIFQGCQPKKQKTPAVSQFIKVDGQNLTATNGENTDQWVAAWTRLMERNNIGWTYWPYKKMGSASSVMNIAMPENWDKIVGYTESLRSSYDEIRKAAPVISLPHSIITVII